jgi:hypothetical protein
MPAVPGRDRATVRFRERPRVAIRERAVEIVAGVNDRDQRRVESQVAGTQQKLIDQGEPEPDQQQGKPAIGLARTTATAQGHGEKSALRRADQQDDRGEIDNGRHRWPDKPDATAVDAAGAGGC